VGHSSRFHQRVHFASLIVRFHFALLGGRVKAEAKAGGPAACQQPIRESCRIAVRYVKAEGNQRDIALGMRTILSTMKR